MPTNNLEKKELNCIHAFREFVGIEAIWCMECGAFKRSRKNWQYPLGVRFSAVRKGKHD